VSKRSLADEIPPFIQIAGIPKSFQSKSFSYHFQLYVFFLARASKRSKTGEMPPLIQIAGIPKSFQSKSFFYHFYFHSF